MFLSKESFIHENLKLFLNSNRVNIISSSKEFNNISIDDLIEKILDSEKHFKDNLTESQVQELYKINNFKNKHIETYDSLTDLNNKYTKEILSDKFCIEKKIIMNDMFEEKIILEGMNNLLKKL
jgi:hypothetical protein